MDNKRYFINSQGHVLHSEHPHSEKHNNRVLFGNSFATKEEAKQVRKILKAILTYSEAEPLEPTPTEKCCGLCRADSDLGLGMVERCANKKCIGCHSKTPVLPCICTNSYVCPAHSQAPKNNIEVIHSGRIDYCLLCDTKHPQDTPHETKEHVKEHPCCFVGEKEIEELPGEMIGGIWYPNGTLAAWPVHFKINELIKAVNRLSKKL